MNKSKWIKYMKQQIWKDLENLRPEMSGEN